MPISKPTCGCTSVCTTCATQEELDNIGILVSGPPRSKEEKKLEKLRRGAERKR